MSLYCGEISCEDQTKKMSTRFDNHVTCHVESLIEKRLYSQVHAPAARAKALCIPFKQPELSSDAGSVFFEMYGDSSKAKFYICCL